MKSVFKAEQTLLEAPTVAPIIYFSERTVAELLSGITVFALVPFEDDTHLYVYIMFGSGYRQKITIGARESAAFPADIIDHALGIITEYKRRDSFERLAGEDNAVCFKYKNEQITRRDIDRESERRGYNHSRFFYSRD